MVLFTGLGKALRPHDVCLDIQLEIWGSAPWFALPKTVANIRARRRLINDQLEYVGRADDSDAHALTPLLLRREIAS